MFKARRFTEGVLVNLQLDQPYIGSGLIKDLLQFTMDEKIYGARHGSVTGGGMYIKLHTKDDAKKIEKFVDKWVKNYKRGLIENS